MVVACWSQRVARAPPSSRCRWRACSGAARASGALLVDLGGDARGARLSRAERSGRGRVARRPATTCRPTGSARIEHELVPGLALVRRGDGLFWPTPLAPRCSPRCSPPTAAPWSSTAVASAAGLDGTQPRSAGCWRRRATHSLLVVRPCYLALRRAVGHELPPVGRRRGERARSRPRAERRRGRSSAFRSVAVVAHDVAVARAVDAGLLGAGCPPRSGGRCGGRRERGVPTSNVTCGPGCARSRARPADHARVRSLGTRRGAAAARARRSAETVEPRVRLAARGARSPRSAARRSRRDRGDGQRRRCGVGRARRRARNASTSSSGGRRPPADRAGRRAARAPRRPPAARSSTRGCPTARVCTPSCVRWPSTGPASPSAGSVPGGYALDELCR